MTFYSGRLSVFAGTTTASTVGYKISKCGYVAASLSYLVAADLARGC